jgi:hypothetical protein
LKTVHACYIFSLARLLLFLDVAQVCRVHSPLNYALLFMQNAHVLRTAQTRRSRTRAHMHRACRFSSSGGTTRTPRSTRIARIQLRSLRGHGRWRMDSDVHVAKECSSGIPRRSRRRVVARCGWCKTGRHYRERRIRGRQVYHQGPRSNSCMASGQAVSRMDEQTRMN